MKQIKHNKNSWSVDASCLGNPGKMEFRCVDNETGEIIFNHFFNLGTNNIGEFLSLAFAMMEMKKRGIKKTIYSDSVTARAWVRNRAIKTNLQRNLTTEQLWVTIDTALSWLKTNKDYDSLVEIWDTKKFGENTADYGRK